MATRSAIRFATREEGISFSELPEKINAQFYAHWDGYPSHRGVEIAESLLHGHKIEGWEIEDLDHRHTDLEYIYYIWQAEGKDTWVSIFERSDYSPMTWHLDYEEIQCFKCIFVGRPTALIDKYKPTIPKYTQEQLDEENNQAILNAEDPNYPEGDDGSIDYRPNTNEEG